MYRTATDWVLTYRQVEALAQCMALTDLECGEWMPSTSSDSDDLARDQLTQIRFAQLVQRRKENGAAPLRRLCFGVGSFIDLVSWQSLSQCTALEELKTEWSSALTADDYSRLAEFQELQILSITGVGCGAPSFAGELLSNLGLVLPALVHCSSLWCLTLCGDFDLTLAHAAMLSHIPSLQRLDCSRLHIESLAPLSGAPELTELSFCGCSGINGVTINIPAMIPRMPLVSNLMITDKCFRQLSAAEWEPVQDALLERLPSLSRDYFIHSSGFY